jgi:hypothetical protein
MGRLAHSLNSLACFPRRPQPAAHAAARNGLRLESLESRAMLSSMPFIATLEGNVAMQFGTAPAPRGSSLQFHVIATHIPWVDLDVDSNNIGGIDPRNGRSGTDDKIEHEAPGLIVPVGAGRAKMEITVPAGRNAMLEIDPAAAGKVKLHTQATQGTLLSFDKVGPNKKPAIDMADVPGGVTIGAATTWTLWVEATAPSDSPGDIVLTLTGDGNGPPAQDIVRATAVAVDLDVDSNNDGTIDPDNAPTGTDDSIEEALTGHIIFVNSDDDDRNGNADVLDVGRVAGENDLGELRLALTPSIGPGVGSIIFTYDETAVRLYTRPDRSGPIASGVPIATGGVFYAEGRIAGTSLVTVTWKVGALQGTDTVSLTVQPYPASIDVDIDSDNNDAFGPPDRSAWEDTLEDHPYGIGKLIMLDNPQRTVTPVWLQLPPGLPAQPGNVRVRIDWNDEGPAGSVRLWNWDVIDALRNPAPVNQGGNRILPGNSYKLSNLRYDAETGRFVIYAEGIKENPTLKTLAGVEAAPRVDERIRGTLVVNGDDAASDEVKYIVANEDSFYYALHTRQEVRNALASRGVYSLPAIAGLPKFGLEPKNAADLRIDPAVAPDLGPNPRVPGLKALIYQDYITGENQYVLAFGGTDDNVWELEFNDWLNNIKQGLGWSAPQYTAAMEIGRAVGRAVGQTRLIVTGHSLGGGLASAAALVAGVRADTFNAAGLHEYTLYERDRNDDPLRNPLGGYIELYPGTAARYTAAGNFINAHYVDHEILNFVQGFIDRTAIGVQREMDGPKDLSLALSVTSFAAAVANRNPWGAAAAGLRFFSTMVELHSFPSILYGLLVTEGSFGRIQIDMLGYNQYF